MNKTQWLSSKSSYSIRGGYIYTLTLTHSHTHTHTHTHTQSLFKDNNSGDATEV